MRSSSVAFSVSSFWKDLEDAEKGEEGQLGSEKRIEEHAGMLLPGVPKR